MGVREDIVRCAEKYLGVPYKSIYGGTGPEDGGFTCSGLTWRAYHDAGVVIPVAQGIHSYYTGSYNGWDTQCGWTLSNGHWTEDEDELVVGDLVFYSPVWDPERTGHVAIYHGDGMVIHANGAPVAITPLWEGGNFVGGGWPLKRLPEDPKPEPEPEPEKLEAVPMDCLITITDQNTVVAVVSGVIHDLTDPDNIRVLDAVYAEGHDGAKMPRLQLSADWYARLVQALTAGLPKHLDKYNNKFKPRS